MPRLPERPVDGATLRALREAAARIELFTGHQCGVVYVAFRGALAAGLATYAPARDVAQLVGVARLHRSRLGFTPVLIPA